MVTWDAPLQRADFRRVQMPTVVRRTGPSDRLATPDEEIR